MRKIFKKQREKGEAVESFIGTVITIIFTMAFISIILTTFSSINDKWNMRQSARKYLLLMETEGYLTDADRQNLLNELDSYGLKNIDLSGTTLSEVDYGDEIVLSITATYDAKVLAQEGTVSKLGSRTEAINIVRRSTAKQ